jgi:uncharacterized hydrophobic protein (TIGR00271 family)
LIGPRDNPNEHERDDVNQGENEPDLMDATDVPDSRRGKEQGLTRQQRREILDQLFAGDRNRTSNIVQFYSLTILSAVIATAGLILPSTSVVIGAMLISPLMTPILGISGAVIMGWPFRAARVAVRLVIGTTVVFAIGYLIPLLFRYPRGMRLTEEVLGRTNPEFADLIVALCAGMAAAYMMVRKEALAALPGVAIAVALVPPLCASGILAYLQEYPLAMEAFILYATNLTAIILAAGGVLLAMGFRPKMRDWRLHLRVGSGLAIAFFLVVTVATPLAYRTIADIGDLRDRSITMAVLDEWVGTDPIEILDVDVEDGIIQIEIFMNLPRSALIGRDQDFLKYLDPDHTIESLKTLLIEEIGKPIEVTVRATLGFSRHSCADAGDCRF